MDAPGNVRGNDKSWVRRRFWNLAPSSLRENCFTTPAGWTIACLMEHVLLEELLDLVDVFLYRLVVATFEHCSHFGLSFFVRELLCEAVIHTLCENLGEEPEIWVFPQDSFKLVQGTKVGPKSGRCVLVLR
jgi:hypothetical protein